MKPLTINGETFYIRELTVGETNELLFGQRKRVLKLAKAQGIELDEDDEEIFERQLRNVADPFAMARTIALRLCDEQGKNLFDADNEEDLQAICDLDASVFNIVTNAIGDFGEKNLPTAEDSK